MHHNGTSALDRPEATTSSPVANIERWNATLTSWGVRDTSADDLPPLYGDSDLPYDPAATGGRK